ncbi:diacylglycerol kinase family protein [Lactobacillus sp. Sy-1]|uniref:diacylglycerol/lipid kinase family protein n=1 Tax=Lactobacillus sp. Sy-1 TaxID=2109645 RepID=UPI001C5A19D7|nr:diacylglycerol kinase family protein [Lactobacillus sp. Sy-1]MBW1605436.1 hypothetical protein [Lactobacillus sp. Sy-1]
MQARYLIIINPTADRGKSKQKWQSIKETLDAGKINYQYRITEYHNHARLITEQYTKDYSNNHQFNNVLLVIGGDGTLNQVISGQKNAILQNHQLEEFPIALVPTGRNNNFALEMGIDRDWQRSLNHALSSSNVLDVNIGFYLNNFNKRYHFFLNNMGIGFESNLLSSKSKHRWKWIQNHFKRIRRFWRILVNLYAIKEFPLYMSVNGKRDQFARVVWVCIYNTPYFDNNKKLMPNANVKSPSLAVLIMENKNILLVTWAILLMFIGKRPHLKSVHQFECNSLKISIPSIEYGNIDNEELGGHFYNANYGITTFKFIN